METKESIEKKKTRAELEDMTHEIRQHVSKLRDDTEYLKAFAEKYNIVLQQKQSEKTAELKRREEYYVIEDQITGEHMKDDSGKQLRYATEQEAEVAARDILLQNAKDTISQYEQSIGRQESVMSQYTEEELLIYAKKCEKYLEFGATVDDCLAGKLNPRNSVEVCSTPQLFAEVGMKSLPMNITQKHLADCMRDNKTGKSHYHGMTVSEVKRVPEALEVPALIAESMSRQDSVVAILGYRENKGNPVMVSIVPEGNAIYELARIESNFITSMYGKDHVESFVENLIVQDKVLYIDKNRSEELALVSLQLRHDHHDLASNTIIRRIGENVNNPRAVSEEKNALDSKKRIDDVTQKKLDSNKENLQKELEMKKIKQQQAKPMKL